MFRKGAQEFFSSVTSKGQVTIPAQVRELLDLKPGEKVAFVVQDGEVGLIRIGSVVAHTAGAFKKEGPPLTAEELRAEAEIAIAEDVMKRSAR